MPDDTPDDFKKSTDPQLFLLGQISGQIKTLQQQINDSQAATNRRIDDLTQAVHQRIDDHQNSVSDRFDAHGKRLTAVETEQRSNRRSTLVTSGGTSAVVATAIEFIRAVIQG